MGKSKDKVVSREAKVDKKLVLGVKRKNLKRKKDRTLDGPVESEVAAEHAGITEDKGLVRNKKVVVMKQKKKHIKLKSSHTESGDTVELLTSKRDETKLKNKKKSKKNLEEVSDPVKGLQSLSDRINAAMPKLKNKQRIRKGRSSDEPNNTEEVLHGNQDEETPSACVNQPALESGDMDMGEPEVKRGKKNKTKKIKKSGKRNKKDKDASNKEDKVGRSIEDDNANVDVIESVDEDCSRGMKKWILEYKQKRPGLKVLQQRIDEFITAHEEQQEQERKEREARAAEDGWTVVVHHKGRKKTTDTETGTAVGSVSLAAMQEKMANKKPKEIDMNFYRFQKREAHISELAMLQSKFEQDKKRIQQLRAQRKFKPY
ncbi:eukaryotic translation initiation factor 5B [Oryza brachyantha]|uniref:Ribosomal RNA-processing protein 7 C-terminal domain-containing protein n=1 Tax=Oryza brachyantha TaxID=4533 RepID=J3LGP7_ORYBR|nr:eukaryotic translation initiation factor 5B [Oryza brachyantha]